MPPHGSGGRFSEAPPSMGAAWGSRFRGKPHRGTRGETATWHTDTSFLINSVFKKTTPNLVSEAAREAGGTTQASAGLLPTTDWCAWQISLCSAVRSTAGSEPTHCPLRPTTDHRATAFSPEPMLKPGQGLGSSCGHHEAGARRPLSGCRCSGARRCRQEWRGSTPG